MKRILFRNATLVTLDPQNPLYRNANLVICNGKIESVGAEAVGNFDRIIDAKDLVLMPGLVNAHTHSPMTLLRGLKDDVDLDLWLSKYIWPAESSLTREDYRVGAMLGIAEMLATGTTCVSDMSCSTPPRKPASRPTSATASSPVTILILTPTPVSRNPWLPLRNGTAMTMAGSSVIPVSRAAGSPLPPCGATLPT